MEVELLEVRDFLARRFPFDGLPPEALAEVARRVSIRYLRREARLDDERVATRLGIVRQGALEVRAGHDRVLARLGEGGLLGYRAFPVAAGDTRLAHVALEDSLLYEIDREVVDSLCADHGGCRHWLASSGAERLAWRRSVRADADRDARMVTRLEAVLAREPVDIAPEATIRAAAELMSRERISSLLVSEAGRLLGIVTDRDLRLKVIAAGLSSDRPVREIMTASPVTLPPDAFVYEAMLLMSRLRIHHLPVCRTDASVVGMVTTSDFIERHTASGTRLAADIHRQPDARGLAGVVARLAALSTRLARRDAPIERIGPVMSGMADAVLERLMDLCGREALPEAGWCWLTGGATGRQEALGAQCQYGALFIDTALDDAVRDRLREFAASVCEGLASCGYALDARSPCAAPQHDHLSSGGFLERVARLVESDHDDDAATLVAWLDCRAVTGDVALWSSPRCELRERIVASQTALAGVRATAMVPEPPIGFFRGRLLRNVAGDGAAGRSVEEASSLDISRDLLSPIVALARWLALTSESDALSTRDRLRAAAEYGSITTTRADSLIDALGHIESICLAGKARDASANGDGAGETSARIEVATLSTDERASLTDAFTVVRDARGELFADGTTTDT